MSAKAHTANDCAKPTWVNLVFQRRGDRVVGLSAGMHGLPHKGDPFHHNYLDGDGNDCDVFGKVYSVVWAVTTLGTFKATVRVEIER